MVTKAVKRAGRRLDVRIHPHMLRHTYARRLHELGVDLHESVATTEVYARVSTMGQRQAVSALEQGAA